MPVSLAEIEKGHEFPPAEFELTAEWVGQYISAVRDESVRALGPSVVPPMAVATLCIRTLLEQSTLPPGSIHAAQELEFERSVRIGDVLSAAARIVSRGERAGWVLLGVSLEATAGGARVMHGRAMLTFPADPEAAN